MSELTREQYVESELAKWKENYLIKLDQEFIIRTMFELQFQYKNTPDEHVKAKKDLIEAIQRILHNLKLVPVLNTDRFKVLVVVNSSHQVVNVFNMFQKMFQDTIPIDNIRVVANGEVRLPKIETRDFEIDIVTGYLPRLQGMRADYILNLTGDKAIDEYFRSQNRI